MAQWLGGLLQGQRVTHFDYGGGNGTLSRLLRESGWDSTSYDPFVDAAMPNRTFDLVTAIEVFEHHPDPSALLRDLQRVTHNVSVVILTTLVSDVVDDPMQWEYLAPRNGHIVLYTKRALKTLFAQNGYQLFSLDENVHVAMRELPVWMENIAA
jgi:2-polyprenyl-3-methyl-5-hydroxy-6-metoxy-1,4-benzoquinol methylase